MRHFNHSMDDRMPEEENDRETHIRYILALAGFSFTAFLGLVVVNLSKATELELEIPIFYLLTSFICFYFALNLQDYKSKMWHDQLGDILIDSAGFTLILTVVYLALGMKYGLWIAGFACVVWIINHSIRIRLTWRFLKLDTTNSQQLNPGGTSMSKTSQEKSVTEKRADQANKTYPIQLEEIRIWDYCSTCQRPMPEGHEHVSAVTQTEPIEVTMIQTWIYCETCGRQMPKGHSHMKYKEYSDEIKRQ